jgi:hypothetical protein
MWFGILVFIHTIKPYRLHFFIFNVLQCIVCALQEEEEEEKKKKNYHNEKQSLQKVQFRCNRLYINDKKVDASCCNKICGNRLLQQNYRCNKPNLLQLRSRCNNLFVIAINYYCNNKLCGNTFINNFKTLIATKLLM